MIMLLMVKVMIMVIIMAELLSSLLNIDIDNNDNAAEGDDNVVHNRTIFLCSLDVRNIVQGGDPLYAGFFLHRALEAILDQNECVFLQKTTV